MILTLFVPCDDIAEQELNTVSAQTVNDDTPLVFCDADQWRMMHLKSAVGLACLPFLVTPVRSQPQLLTTAPPSYSAIPITFGGSGYGSGLASSINNRGEVVGVLENRAFIFSDGHPVDLGKVLGDDISFATDVNDDSTIVGYSTVVDSNLGGQKSIPWIVSGGAAQHLALLPGSLETSAVSINNLGQVLLSTTRLIDSQSYNVFRTFLREPSGSLKDLGGIGVCGYGWFVDINDSSVCVGYSSDFCDSGDKSTHAMAFDGGLVDLGSSFVRYKDSVDKTKRALAINSIGEIVGTKGLPGDLTQNRWLKYGGWIRTGGNEVSIPSLGGQDCFPAAINSRSVVVGSAQNVNNEYRGFLFDDAVSRDINDLIQTEFDLTITECYSINDLGQIAAAGVPAPGFARKPVLIDPRVKGVDVSYASHAVGDSKIAPPVRWFEGLKAADYAFVIVGGWTGVRRNPLAETQLRNARQAKLDTAGYCLLNYASAKDGGCQIREALIAFGDEAHNLGFLAVDVEFDLTYPGYYPAGLQSATPSIEAQRDALARIAEAISEIRKVGLKPVIYTNKGHWQQITGNSQEFSDIALWQTYLGKRSDSDYSFPVKNLDIPDPRTIRLGGWKSNSGRQYDLTLEDHTVQFDGVNVDFNVFNLSTFRRVNRDFKFDKTALQISRGRNGTTILCWEDPNAILQTAPTLMGPWIDTAPTNPYEVDIEHSTAAGFFRLVPREQ